MAPVPELGEWAALAEESGSLGGRLARALAGEDGAEARFVAYDALNKILGYRFEQGIWWYQPEWMAREAVPALLATTLAPGDLRALAFILLGGALYRGPSANKDAVLAAWAAAPAALADALYQEPLDHVLVGACAQTIGQIAVPGWLAEPGPLLGAVAAFLRRFRLQGVGQRNLSDMDDLLRSERIFSAEAVLSDETLSRELAAFLRLADFDPDGPLLGPGQYRVAQYTEERLLLGVAAGDERLCRFLRQGFAEACVRGLRRLPLVWVDSVARLLEAGPVGPEALALRAQLFRDAGLGDYLLNLRGFGGDPGLVDLESRYAAALRLATARPSALPFDLRF